MQNQPIFIVSSERSGSNLLRTLLDNHSNISGPRAPHLLKLFHQISFHFLPLEDPANAIALISEMLLIVNHEQCGWNLEATANEIYERHQPRSFLGCFDALYRQKLLPLPAKRFVCKENKLFKFVGGLSEHYADPQYLYLYRDPRDYAASWLKVPFHFNTPLHAAVSWKQEQKACLQQFSVYNRSAMFVSYESLISNTQSVMEQVLRFVGEPLEEACFSTGSKSNEQDSESPFWKNLNKDVDASNQKKYRNELSESDIRVIESSAKDIMQRLGYELETPADWKTSYGFRVKNAIRSWRTKRRLERLHAKTVETLAKRNQVLLEIRKRARSRTPELLKSPNEPWQPNHANDSTKAQSGFDV